MITPVDRFWAQVQLELADLPRPGDVVPGVRCIDPDLYLDLVDGERWLLDPARTVAELRRGWAVWLPLFRRAAQLVEA